VLTGLAVEFALMPIALYHFHKAGLYGAFANILAIPLTTFVIMPLEALALLFDLAGAGAPIWWAVGKGAHVPARPGALDSECARARRHAAEHAHFRFRADGRRRGLAGAVADGAGGSGAWHRWPPARCGRSPRLSPT
jgi:predicted membrane metal-binding protein